MNNNTTTEAWKMIRQQACHVIQNHDYKLTKVLERGFQYECEHCKQMLLTQRRLSDKELKEILMRY